MNAPEPRSYAFGRFHLDPLRGRLTNSGTAIELRPKSLAVLHYLVSHPQRLISKDELLSAVWGKVIVTEDSLVQCVREIRNALGDTDQQIVRTIPRGGYLLAATVKDNAPEPLLTAEPPSQARWQDLAARLRGRRLAAGAIACAVLAAATIAGLILWRTGERPDMGPSVGAPPLSIVVLPLAIIDGDREHEYFAQGLTNDLTTDLGRIPSGLVISHNSAQAYRDRQIDSREVSRVGRALRARGQRAAHWRCGAS